MNPKRILIVNIRSLLIEGIESLLKANGEFVVRSTFSEDHTALIREIEQLRPHIIIVDEITTFVEPAQLIASLLNVQNVRLIVVNNYGETMEIYDRYECAISNSNQFITAISSNGNSVNLH
jgi:DNA-binding NarL/FixJ family response regulator